MATKLDENFLDVTKRTVALIGDVDSELSTRCFMAFQRFTGTAPITVFLDTQGGDIDEGLFIYDTILDAEAHVTIKVLSKCWSMGAIILQASDERLIHPNATLMGHTGTNAYPEGPANDVKAAILHDTRQAKRCDDILFAKLRAADPRYSRARFEKFNNTGAYLSADQALLLGLVDKIQRG